MTEDSMSISAETLGRKFLSTDVVDDPYSNNLSTFKRSHKNMNQPKKKKWKFNKLVNNTLF